jgi:hypothetical protein
VRSCVERHTSAGLTVRSAGFLSIVLLVLCVAAPAPASQLVARNVTNLKLAVNASGKKALLTYKVDGKMKHTLVMGAINALQPSETAKQVAFDVDYTGGGKTFWKKFKNKCQPYDGPELVFFVAACKARDGSYWAVQAWQFWFPFFGYQPFLAYQDDFAFHVSHWTGPIAELELWADWIDVTVPGKKPPHNVSGRLMYQGTPVYGFKAGNGGQPLDGYGRVVYYDTFDSLLGPGWWRKTGILARKPTGTFCHAMIPQPTFSNYPNPHVVDAGNGTRYRVYVAGPGVTPAVIAEVEDPGDYDPNDKDDVARQEAGKLLLQEWGAPPACLKGH